MKVTFTLEPRIITSCVLLAFCSWLLGKLLPSTTFLVSCQKNFDIFRPEIYGDFQKSPYISGPKKSKIFLAWSLRVRRRCSQIFKSIERNIRTIFENAPAILLLCFLVPIVVLCTVCLLVFQKSFGFFGADTAREKHLSRAVSAQKKPKSRGSSTFPVGIVRNFSRAVTRPAAVLMMTGLTVPVCPVLREVFEIFFWLFSVHTIVKWGFLNFPIL